MALFFMKNLLAGLLFLFLILVLISNVKGYNWMFKNLLKDNLRIITEHSSISTEKKWEAKRKFPAKYLIHVEKNLPDTAVVLFPFDSTHLENPPKLKFVDRTKQTFMRKPFLTYFLYPRKVVFAYEKGKNPLYEKITHVAIIDRMGYEHLKYKVNGNPRYTALPIDRPPRKSKKPSNK